MQGRKPTRLNIPVLKAASYEKVPAIGFLHPNLPKTRNWG